MNISAVLKWLSFAYEGFLGIPIIGGAFILGFGWAPLGIAFILHLVTLIFSIRQGVGKVGSILGLVTSAIGFIPVLGMIMHIITALVLLVSAIMNNKKVAV
jgi:hypothetical protein